MMVAFHSHRFALHPKIENQHKAIFTFDLIFKKFRTLLLSPWVGKVKMSFLSSSHSTQGLHDVILVWWQILDRLQSILSDSDLTVNCFSSNHLPTSCSPDTHSKRPWREKSLFSTCAVSTMMACLMRSCMQTHTSCQVPSEFVFTVANFSTIQRFHGDYLTI